jgi:type IV secretion system protein VirB5
MTLHKSTGNLNLKSDIPNPFLQGQDKAFSDVLLHSMNEAKHWRLTAVGVLVFGAVSLCLLFYAVNMQKTVPVLINVMPSGETQYLGEVKQGQAAKAVPESAIVWEVREFVTMLRSVPADAQVLYNNIDNCYKFVTASYEPAMTAMLRAASPFDLVGKQRRSVEIETVIKVTGSSYQIDWFETLTEASTQRRTVRMRALVTIKLLPVTDATVKQNPLGIYVDALEMTQI